MLKNITFGILLLAAATTPAFAHLDPAAHGSLAAGFTHPLFGMDHVLAMVVVGLWAAMLGGRALFLVPVAFVSTMLAGFLLALTGAPLPLVEPVILGSIVVLGLLVALARPVPLWASVSLVGAFALFHGFAHGGELGGAGALDYAQGFALATTLLHLTGIGAVLVARAISAPNSAVFARFAGFSAAFGGVWLAFVG